MNNHKLSVSLALLLALLVSAACAGSNDDDDQGSQAPQATIDNVTPFQGVSGTVNVEVTVSGDPTKVELLVDGAVAASSEASPFTLAWDTTAVSDGAVSLSARASNAAGSADSPAVYAVVINGGEVVQLNEGADGSIDIPADYNGTQEVDVKHHWSSDADGFKRCIAVMVFDDAAKADKWEIELSAGSGYCPHSGQVYGDPLTKDSSPIILDVTPDGGFPAGTQLFVHAKPVNAADHKGQSLAYKVYVFSFD